MSEEISRVEIAEAIKRGVNKWMDYAKTLPDNATGYTGMAYFCADEVLALFMTNDPRPIATRKYVGRHSPSSLPRAK